VRQITFDPAAFGHALCIIDSGGSHANMSGAYGEIPEEMIRVARLLGHERLAFADKRDFLRELPRLRREAGDRAVLRAWHFFGDTARARVEASALEDGRFADFLRLVRDSGRSSAQLLQNVYLSGAVQEQAVPVALALCEELLAGKGACRVHGGGFAGTVQAFVPDALLSAFRSGVDAVLGQGSCHVLAVRPVGGTVL
jgi:galactokinase